MKNLFKWLGIATLVLAIVFMMGACSNTTNSGVADPNGGDPSGSSLVGTWNGTGTAEGKTLVMTASGWDFDGMEGTYDANGTLKYNGANVGTATLNGGTLTVEITMGTPVTYTFTKAGGEEPGGEEPGGEEPGGGSLVGTWNGTGTSAGKTLVMTASGWDFDGMEGTYDANGTLKYNGANVGTATLNGGTLTVEITMGTTVTTYTFTKASGGNPGGEEPGGEEPGGEEPGGEEPGGEEPGGEEPGNEEPEEEEPTVSKPNAPTGVKATATGSKSIELTWDSVPDAESYKIYSPNEQGKTTGYELLKTVYTNSYTDDTVTPGQTWYYKVSAVNSEGEGPQSSAVFAKSFNYLPKPNNVVATHASYASRLNTSRDSIKITWDAVSGAANYNVYTWVTYLGGYWDQVGFAVTGTSFTHTGLTPNKEYLYIVAAVDSSGVEGADSSYAGGMTAK